ncbi:MAG: sigma-70 family RNA polymerase sigma factor [Armatimonadetes bacterium]|nr:sigma-70 family RNA polymerase sigma factor [Armatimonadota bacterium]NIM76305.1 sigma-70 family RNA polymerase sigma factor [Armatimonadota bacterium]NIO75104.1 sigma-70 family RNA polymerase sigma factor [Armatimonadota bacterium]
MPNADGASAAGHIAMTQPGETLAGARMAGSDHCQESARDLAADSFEDLFTCYERKIFNLILRLVGDYEEATDLTSDTFVQALRGLPKFRRQSQPYTWLYRIAVNLCKNHFRRKAHRARFFAFSLDQGRESDGEESTPEIEDCRYEPGRVLEERELQREVEKAIGALAPDLRMAVVLRDFQGLSYQEMAEILDCSLEAIKSRLFRARAALRKSLAAHVSTASETSGD